MAGAHRAAVPGVTLRAYIESRLAEMDRRFADNLTALAAQFRDGLSAQDKAVQIAMIASEKAVVKAEVAAEKRFEATNEFRGQLSDQAATFMPRAEAEQRLAALAEKTEQGQKSLLDKIDDLKGTSRAGARALWSYALGAMGVVGVLYGIINTR